MSNFCCWEYGPLERAICIRFFSVSTKERDSYFSSGRNPSKVLWIVAVWPDRELNVLLLRFLKIFSKAIPTSPEILTSLSISSLVPSIIPNIASYRRFGPIPSFSGLQSGKILPITNRIKIGSSSSGRSGRTRLMMPIISSRPEIPSSCSQMRANSIKSIRRLPFENSIGGINE